MYLKNLFNRSGKIYAILVIRYYYYNVRGWFKNSLSVVNIPYFWMNLHFPNLFWLSFYIVKFINIVELSEKLLWMKNKQLETKMG